jgi:hypothetical protein
MVKHSLGSKFCCFFVVIILLEKKFSPEVFDHTLSFSYSVFSGCNLWKMDLNATCISWWHELFWLNVDI